MTPEVGSMDVDRFKTREIIDISSPKESRWLVLPVSIWRRQADWRIKFHMSTVWDEQSHPVLWTSESRLVASTEATLS